MASNITPNNIDGNYPIAGQDNSSQGFRDNFTNIKNNLTVAKTEITDLQNKVILKSALTGITLDNDMEGTAIGNLTVLGMRDTINDLGTDSGGLDIDFDLGHTHILTMNGSSTFTFANFPTDAHSQVSLFVTVANIAHTLTLNGVDATNQAWSGHIDTITNEITFPATGTYQIKIGSNDGLTFYIDSFDLSPNYVATPIRTTTERVTDGNTITGANAPAVWFETAGTESCTLDDGAEGEIRTFVMKVDNGNMVVNVNNYGWPAGVGTITFNDVGDGCTLQFIDGAWYCIGNNGCSFA